MISEFFKCSPQRCGSRPWIGLAGALLIGLASPLGAQEAAETANAELVPTERHLAAALSDPELRTGTLLTLVAVERLREYGGMAHPRDVAAMIRRFGEDRSWLDRLAAHYVEVPLRGLQLDPAAWWVALELGQYRMQAGTLSGPEGPDDAGLINRVFDRANEELAAQTLPELLQRMEGRAVSVWQATRDASSANRALQEILLRLSADHFDAWTRVPTLEAAAAHTQDGPLASAAEEVAALAADVLEVGPPERTRLRRLRFELFTAMAQLDEASREDAARLLALASALEGINEQRYLELTETLLWVVSDLFLAAEQRLAAESAPPDAELTQPAPGDSASVESALPEPPEQSVTSPDPTRVPRLLYDLLPRLSRTLAADLSQVDRRIDHILANLYETVQFLQADQPDPLRLTALRTRLADSVAQYALLLPEMSIYFDQPVRWPISEEIDICLVQATNRAEDERSLMTAEQFDSCVDRLVTIATEWVSREDLAGDRDGPFGSEHLRRELMLPPWQRVNYALGYLHERYATGCSLPEEPLPNPVEWAGIVNLVAWFASQAPDLVNTPANRERIERLRQQGSSLLRGMSQQVDCISGAGTGIGDPVMRGVSDYRASLDKLVGTLREAEIEFREERLENGADVVLGGDANQRTGYRKEGLMIGPCDPANVCEMNGELEAGPRLVGLFSPPYLISDQTRMGEIEICYDNVHWIERRSEAVRPDDPYVANYYGRLSFDIIGRHHEKGETTDVFGYTFRSPEEYHYLFAQASDEVGADDCPMEWVGSRIVAPLADTGAVRVVPNRLTYLAGARSLPSEIIAANWSRGEKWRDWLVGGPALTAHDYPADAGMADRVNRHLQALYRAKQARIYSALLRPDRTGSRGGSDELYELQLALSADKALIRSYLILFYPAVLTSEAGIRGALEGEESLLDTDVFRRFHEENVAVSSINEIGRSRLQRFRARWDRQPDAMRRSGSIARSVSHALLRLNEIEARYLRQKPVMTPRGLRG